MSKNNTSQNVGAKFSNVAINFGKPNGNGQRRAMVVGPRKSTGRGSAATPPNKISAPAPITLPSMKSENVATTTTSSGVSATNPWNLNTTNTFPPKESTTEKASTAPAEKSKPIEKSSFEREDRIPSAWANRGQATAVPREKKKVIENTEPKKEEKPQAPPKKIVEKKEEEVESSHQVSQNVPKNNDQKTVLMKREKPITDVTKPISYSDVALASVASEKAHHTNGIHPPSQSVDLEKSRTAPVNHKKIYESYTSSETSQSNDEERERREKERAERMMTSVPKKTAAPKKQPKPQPESQQAPQESTQQTEPAEKHQDKKEDQKSDEPKVEPPQPSTPTRPKPDRKPKPKSVKVKYVAKGDDTAPSTPSEKPAELPAETRTPEPRNNKNGKRRPNAGQHFVKTDDKDKHDETKPDTQEPRERRQYRPKDSFNQAPLLEGNKDKTPRKKDRPNKKNISQEIQVTVANDQPIKLNTVKLDQPQVGIDHGNPDDGFITVSKKKQKKDQKDQKESKDGKEFNRKNKEKREHRPRPKQDASEPQKTEETPAVEPKAPEVPVTAAVVENEPVQLQTQATVVPVEKTEPEIEQLPEQTSVEVSEPVSPSDLSQQYQEAQWAQEQMNKQHYSQQQAQYRYQMPTPYMQMKPVQSGWEGHYPYPTFPVFVVPYGNSQPMYGQHPGFVPYNPYFSQPMMQNPYMTQEMWTHTVPQTYQATETEYQPRRRYYNSFQQHSKPNYYHQQQHGYHQNQHDYSKAQQLQPQQQLEQNSKVEEEEQTADPQLPHSIVEDAVVSDSVNSKPATPKALKMNKKSIYVPKPIPKPS